jgi:hypothetical protein
MMDVRQQVVTGVVPPQLGEALIRQTWPSVQRFSGPASLGRVLMSHAWLRPLAPLSWLLMAPLYFIKVVPGFATCYTLTNQRLMIRRGIKPVPSHQVALRDIDDVRLKTDANSEFYRAATLEVLSQGKVVLTLPGVPDAESFRHTILNASKAWGPSLAPAAASPNGPAR